VECLFASSSSAWYDAAIWAAAEQQRAQVMAFGR
jgi:hypothetical protein